MKRENLIAHSKCLDDGGFTFVKGEIVRAMCWLFEIIQISNIVVGVVNIGVECVERMLLMFRDIVRGRRVRVTVLIFGVGLRHLWEHVA